MPMPRSRKTIDASVTQAKLDDLVGAVRREVEGADADPFDEAMVAAVARIAEAMKAEADALAGRAVRLLRKAPR